MKQRIVLLGPPASGKGTQAELIRERLGIISTSPGAMLRQEVAAGTVLGAKAEKLTSAGQLLPDEMIVSLVRAWLDGHEGGFVFDGFPRTAGQADALDAMLAQRGTPLEAVLVLNVTLGCIHDRVARRLVCTKCSSNFSLGLHVQSETEPCLRCGATLGRRSDDNFEALETRMAEYHEKTEPLISYYATRDIAHGIDACRPPEEVFNLISEILR